MRRARSLSTRFIGPIAAILCLMSVTAQAEIRDFKASPKPCYARFGHHLATLWNARLNVQRSVIVSGHRFISDDPVSCIAVGSIEYWWRAKGFVSGWLTKGFGANAAASFRYESCSEREIGFDKGYYEVAAKLASFVTETDQVCGLLTQLRVAHPPRRSFIDQRVDISLFKRLSASEAGAVGIEQPKKTSKSATIGDLEKAGAFSSIVMDEGRISYWVEESDGTKWKVSISETARSDIDGDGTEDVALYVTEYMYGGSGMRYGHVWLTVRSKGARPELIDIEPVLEAARKN